MMASVSEIKAKPRKPRVRRRKRLSKGQRKLARREKYYNTRYSTDQFAKPPLGCDCDPAPRFNSDICPRCGGCFGIKRRCAAVCACFGAGADAAEFAAEFMSDRRWGGWLRDWNDRADGRCFMCGAGSTRTLPFIGRHDSYAAYKRLNRRERLCLDLQACRRREASRATPYAIMLHVKYRRRARWSRGLPSNDNFNFADAFGESSDRMMEMLDKALAACKANPQLRQTLWVIKPAWDEFEPYSLYLCAACPLKPPYGKCPLASGERQGRLMEYAYALS